MFQRFSRLPELPIALRHGSHGNAGLMVCSVQRLYKELKKQEAQLLSDESAGWESFQGAASQAAEQRVADRRKARPDLIPV